MTNMGNGYVQKESQKDIVMVSAIGPLMLKLVYTLFFWKESR